MKFCPKCKTEKRITEFHKGNNRSDGRAGYCGKCCYLTQKAWRRRLGNTEAGKVIKAIMQIKNQTSKACLMSRIKWCKNNKEKLSA